MLTVTLDVNGRPISVLEIRNIRDYQLLSNWAEYEAGLAGAPRKEIGIHDRARGAWPLVAQAIDRLGLNKEATDET